MSETIGGQVEFSSAITRMHGDTIRVTQLHYARAAADLGSFSAAAASLGVTQPSLSRGIAALERVLGGALFQRTTTGVEPTALAARVLPRLRDTLGSLESMLSEARAAAEQLPLRMGVSPLIDPRLVGRAFQATRRDGAAALVLREDDLAVLRAALLAQELDLIMVPAVASPGPALRRREIDSDELLYRPGTDDDETGPIELADLGGEAVVMVGESCGLNTFVRSLFTHAGTPLSEYPGAADSYRSVEEWARLGLGSALLPASRFTDREHTRPVHFQGQPVRIRYEALWPASSAHARDVETLLDAIALDA